MNPSDTVTPPRAGWILACVVVVQFLVSMDLSLVNVALPGARADLGLDDLTLNWVVVAYLLVYGGFLMAGGRIGDLTGRRRVVIGGLIVFGLASVLGGAAPSGAVLVAARALQGLGAAFSAPAALALVAGHFAQGAPRSRALGWWAAASVAGGAIGVVASGVLTDTLGWRAVLWVNVPIVLIALLTALRLPPDRHARGGRPDLAGALLVTVGMALLILGVAGSDGGGWGSARTLGLIVAGLALLAAFVVVERRVREPLLRLGLLGHRAVLAANAFGFLITAGQLASFFFVSLHMQQVLGFSPLVTGLAFLPFCAASLIGMRIAARTLPTVGPRRILVGGGLLGAVGVAWYGLGGPGGTFLSDILGPSVLAGIGIGASFVAMGGAATTGVPAGEAGMVSGLLNSFRLIGGSLGLAVLGTVAASVTTAAGGAGDVAARSSGYATALFVAGGLVAVGSLFCLIIPARPREPAEVTPSRAGAEPATPADGA